jgi:triacylglycerol esterase/lipase EstA (alpha/beta hydrolase family)
MPGPVHKSELSAFDIKVSKVVPSVPQLQAESASGTQGLTIQELHGFLSAAFPAEINEQYEGEWPFAYAVGMAASIGLLMWLATFLAIVRFF